MTGRIRAFAELQLLGTVSAAFSLIAIMFGNWLYIYDRAKTPETSRSYFIATVPDIHAIFFEFKEFGALFTLRSPRFSDCRSSTSSSSSDSAPW